MPLVNLIESNLILRRQAGLKARTSRMALIGSAALMGIGVFMLLGKAAILSSEENQLQTQIARMKPLIKEIDDIKATEGDLGPRLRTLEDAQALTARWGNLLDHITANTPTDAWFTSIRSVQSTPEKPIEVTFAGVCRTQRDAQELVLRLQNAFDLESVNLDGTQEKVMDKQLAIEFAVKGAIVGTAKKAEKKAEEDAKA